MALKCLSLGSGCLSTCLGKCGGMNATWNVPDRFLTAMNPAFVGRWWQKQSYHTIWTVHDLAQGQGQVLRNRS